MKLNLSASTNHKIVSQPLNYSSISQPMNPALTKIGAQMSHLTGVRAIMKDINETLRAGAGQQFINLSAGNPLILPEVETTVAGLYRTIAS